MSVLAIALRITCGNLERVDVPTGSLLSDINVRKHIEFLEMTTRGCREKETPRNGSVGRVAAFDVQLASGYDGIWLIVFVLECDELMVFLEFIEQQD